MSGFVKFLLVVVLIVGLLFNYKILSPRGFVNFEEPDMKAIEFAMSIKSIEYYKNPMAVKENADKSYIVIFYTNEGNYLSIVNGSDIPVFRALELVVGSEKVKEIEPWHWGYFLGAFIIVLIIPSSTRKEPENRLVVKE